jgi:hypothetical protein
MDAHHYVLMFLNQALLTIIYHKQLSKMSAQHYEFASVSSDGSADNE